MKTPDELTYQQLRELALLRLRNEQVRITPLNVEIESRGYHFGHQSGYYSVIYWIETEYSGGHHRFSFVFSRLYPNEFVLLRKWGVNLLEPKTDEEMSNETDRIEKLEHAVALLNSMVESGEAHSEESREIVRQAMEDK